MSHTRILFYMDTNMKDKAILVISSGNLAFLRPQLGDS